VEYIALLEQMESGLHWEVEIAWLPAKSGVLAVVAGAPPPGLAAAQKSLSALAKPGRGMGSIT